MEIENRYKPALKDELPDIGGYEVIFAGSPNWRATIAPPAATFLSNFDLRAKRAIPSATHGGESLNGTVSDVKKLCRAANFGESIDAAYNESVTELINYLKLD
jgi:hypothetical protein